jgi:D-glycero-D-manno-heptose 1,7-bisphosphate phosphatase
MAAELTQAVILAGGRGERMRPLTDTCPKPMIGVHGRPFLAYLLDNLREQGIKTVLILLGYLPNVVMDYFKDGKDFGLKIEYVVSPESDDTGTRMRLAASKMDDLFLFMYCDNYWPLRLEDMMTAYRKGGREAQITVYANTDNYTRSNVNVSNGNVAIYDRKRTAPNLSGVDIGYGIFNKSVLRHLGPGNVHFEEEVYPRLVAEGQLGAYWSDHRYYSVGSFERLKLTEEFLSRSPAIILDRDGVLNRRPPKAEYVKTWSEWSWLPEAQPALRELKKAGFRVIIITNQAGIARGAMTENDLSAIHQQMRTEAQAAGGDIDRVYHCPHGWDEGCSCRKPLPGMLFMAQKDFSLDLTRTWFIGDDERDEQAGRAAGCKTVLVSPERGLLSIVRRIIDEI